MNDIELSIATKPHTCDSCGDEIFVGKPFLIQTDTDKKTYQLCSVYCIKIR